VTSLGAPTEGDAVAAAFRRVLTDHRIPEGDERANAASCVHLEGYGTRSSCIVRVGADPGSPPVVQVADGPPCSAAYEDAAAWWARPSAGPAASSQSRTSGL
jgi:hypothetical protein